MPGFEGGSGCTGGVLMIPDVVAVYNNCGPDTTNPAFCISPNILNIKRLRERRPRPLVRIAGSLLGKRGDIYGFTSIPEKGSFHPSCFGTFLRFPAFTHADVTAIIKWDS